MLTACSDVVKVVFTWVYDEKTGNFGSSKNVQDTKKMMTSFSILPWRLLRRLSMRLLRITHILVLTCQLQQSGMLTVYMFVPFHHIPNMSKTQPLDLNKGSRCAESSSENLCIQIVYYEIDYQIFRANLLYRLSHSFRGRGSKPCISI